MGIITAKEAADIVIKYKIPETLEERMLEIYEMNKFNAKYGCRNILVQLFLAPENVEAIIQELTSKGFEAEKYNPRMDYYCAVLIISW